MRNDLVMKGTNDYKKNYDPIIRDSKPFKAKDGSYHSTMEEVEKANEDYFRKEKENLVSVKEQLSCYINGVRVEPQTTTEWDTIEDKSKINGR